MRAFGPIHTGALEPGTDGDLASRLDHAGGSTESLGVESRVTHASPTVEEVQRAWGGLGAGRAMGQQGVDYGR